MNQNEKRRPSASSSSAPNNINNNNTSSESQPGCSSTTLSENASTDGGGTGGGGPPSTTTATATTSSLLLQDDELGSDLLLAIRDWNTESRTGSEAFHYSNNDTDIDDGSCSDDKNHSLPLLESAAAAVATSLKTPGTADKTASSSFKTSNYSSKPSAITDRLLKSLNTTTTTTAPAMAPPMSIIAEMDGAFVAEAAENGVMDDDDTFDEVLDEHEVIANNQQQQQRRATTTAATQIWNGLEEEFSLYSEDEEEEDLASLYKQNRCHHHNDDGGIGNTRDHLALSYPQQQYRNDDAAAAADYRNHQAMTTLEDDSDMMRSLETTTAVDDIVDQAPTASSYEYYYEQQDQNHTRAPFAVEDSSRISKGYEDGIDYIPHAIQQTEEAISYNHGHSSMQPPPQAQEYEEEEECLPRQQHEQRRKLTAEELYVKREYLKRQLAVVETQLYVDHGILFHQEYNNYKTTYEDDEEKEKKKGASRKSSDYASQSPQQTEEKIDVEKDDTNKKLLQEACYSLGLPNSRTDALVPTIQKMVNVVMKHVPKLEEFVEEVCDLVLVDDDEKSNNTKKKDKKNKKTNKKSTMKQKQERMENAINNLRKQKVEKESYAPNLTSSRSFDQTSKGGGKEDYSVSSSVSAKSRASRSSVAAALSFQKAVLDQLELRQQREHNSKRKSYTKSSSKRKCSTPPRRRRSSHTSESSQHTTPSCISDDEALKIIQHLIEFEYRNKKSLYCGPRELPDDEAKKYGGLLAADATTLRRYVSYFMHLFNVRHVNGVRPKMNEVYVYSTAMTSMFRDMREALHMEPSSPAQDVARRVVEISNNVGDSDALCQ